MKGKINFDYYYGIEAEQFAFYRVPRLLIKDERFKGLSSDASSIKVSEVIESDDFYVDDMKIIDYRRKLRGEGQKLGLYNFELSRQKFELERRRWSTGI